MRENRGRLRGIPPTQEPHAPHSSGDQSAYPLRVAYDAYALVCSDGGSGKGAQLRNLLKGAGSSSFVGLGPLTSIYNDAHPSHEGEHGTLIQRGRAPYLMWQQTYLPFLLAKIKPHVFLAPYNTAPFRIPHKTKLISVVHDLILFEKFAGLTLKRRLRDRYRAALMHNAIMRSSLILTVSDFTADHIKLRFPQANPRVIHCTVGPSWYVRRDAVPLSRREPYILIVTSFAAHKNVPNAMAAFARFRARSPRSTVKLRMVGVSYHRPLVEQLMRRCGLPADSVIVEPFLNEVELQHAYRHALCALVPSLMEGFGIPALEAMASGTPLLSSNRWSLPEVGGDAPLYFNPSDLEEMATALCQVCASPTLRSCLTERGLLRAERFHPDRIGIEVADFWRQLPELYDSWNR